MNKLMLLPIFAVTMLVFGSISMAEATHANWGNVEDSGTGVHPAKVTFEKAGEYFWDDTGSSSGNYYKVITPNGSGGWTISAMADGYDRHVKTGQSEGAGGNDFDIDTRSENTIKFKIAYDDTTSVTVTEARNELVRAEPWFEDEHGIVFDEWNANASWTSSGQSTTDSCAVRAHAASDANWSAGNYGTSDILAAYSDGHMTGSKGCGTIPGSANQHPSHYVDIVTGDEGWERDRRVAHELTHNFGFSHASCSGSVPSLMTVSGSGCEYITNWSPANDITMEDRRGWYN